MTRTRTPLSWIVSGLLCVACAAGGEDNGVDDDDGGTNEGGATPSGPSTGGSSAGGAAPAGGAGTSNGPGGSSSGGAGGTASGSGGTGGGTGGTGTGGMGTGGAGGSPIADPPGTLLYEKVLNNSILDDFLRVRWHPSGAFALVLGTGGKLIRHDAGGGVTLVDTLGSRVDDLDVAADGSFFLVVGADTTGKMWRVAVDAGMNLTVSEELALSLGQPRAIARHDDDTWAIGAYGTDSISYLYLWDEANGITVTKAFNAGAGLTDLMWGDPLPLASNVVHTSHGTNGADSKTYVVSSDMLVSNGWSAGFGNAGGAGWRPGGTYGYFTGSASNKLYVYDGSWTLHTLPNVGTAAAPQSVAWNATGTRALVVGRAIGPGLSATIIDHRAGTNASFSVNDLVDQSIPNFDMTPWFGNSSSYLNAADWRPSTGCAEGLIAADDNGTSLNPTFGLLIRFYDSSDPDC